MEKNNLPLFNDLNKYYKFNPNEYFDPKIIEMHNNLNINNNYTNEEIYNYIKFLNLCCVETNDYKIISNYITTENYEYFISLFNNINIKDELFKVLDDKVCKSYSFFKDWLSLNFNNIGDNIDLSEYIIYENQCKYYKINDKIFIKNNNNYEIYGYFLIKDINKIFYYNLYDNNTEICLNNDGKLIDIIKYINENYEISKHYDGLLIFSSFSGNVEIIKYLLDNGAIINDNNIKNILRQASIYNRLNVIKYLVNYLKNNIKITEYINYALKKI